MLALLSAAAVAFGVSILGTPYAIRFLRRRSIGQFIQEEVEGHSHKRGTPTMGGVVIVGAVIIAYVVSHVSFWSQDGGLGLDVRGFKAGGLLMVFAFVGMGLIGFIDDYRKYTRERNLGIGKAAKFGGQLAIAGGFAWWAVEAGVATEVGFTRSLGINLGIAYFIWVLLMLTATANAVNITDGLDGLVAGSGALVFGAYTIILFWIFRNDSFYGRFLATELSALELAIFAASLFGALLGFLWWNTAPARIFMGDVGSQSIGGALAALALVSNTDLLLLLLGGLYVMETVTVIIQIISFRGFGRRVFRMTPIHHHFELVGWPETTIIVRFWILAALGVALALGAFYGDFITNGGVDAVRGVI
jgi:phospho-N-acetylmuramoyl-pentapeptide-transferase